MNAPANLPPIPARIDGRKIVDRFGLTAAERYGPGNAYAFIIVGWRMGKPQHGTTFYTYEADAQADADFFARQPGCEWSYTVERVRTSVLCLTHEPRFAGAEPVVVGRR